MVHATTTLRNMRIERNHMMRSGSSQVLGSVRLQRSRLGARHEDLAIRSVIFLYAMCEVDCLLVRRPARCGAAPFGVGDETHIGAVRVHHKNLVAMTATIGCERDLLSIGRPRRPAIEERIVR